jgi:CubicO group peptidase (beta-lactamase class C family)
MKQGHARYVDAGRRMKGRRVRPLAVTPVLAALVLLLLVALAPAAQASRYSRTIRDGRAAARALLEQTGAPSLSLALVSNGRVVWCQSFGYADVETQTAPTPTTMYGIGSVSKTVATVALMQLVDDGLVSLDEPVVTYLPKFRMSSPGYRAVTVRMLLDHSSGFPGSAYGSAMSTDYWPGYLDQVTGALADARLKHTPGALSVYCNDGFTLIEGIVANVTGRPFPEYVQEEVLGALGMTHSAYPLAPFADGSYAKAYGDDGSANPREVVNALASGGLYSTPTDMAQLATMFMSRGAYGGGQVLSADAVREMGSDQTVGEISPAVFKAARYGLGWDSVTQPGLLKAGFTAWMKGGDSSDYHAGFVVVPGQRLAAVVMGVAPLDSGKAETLCERILLHALVDRGALRRIPAPIPAAAPPLKTATSAQLRAVQGYWAGNSLLLKAESGSDAQSITISTLGQDGAWHEMVSGLRMRTDGRFHRKGSATSLRVASAAGRRYLIDRLVAGNGFYYDNMPLVQKLSAGEPLSKAWDSRVGDWWLAVNECPTSMLWGSGGPLLQVADVPGLEGYLLANTQSYGTQIVDPDENDDAALMFLQIPGFGSRDMNDLVVEQHGGDEWLWYGTTFYRPLDSVPALAVGANTVTTTPEGYAEWRTVSSTSLLTIDAGSRWRVYDAGMDLLATGTTYPAVVELPAGGYVCLFAPAGTSATVNLEPSVHGGAAAAPQASPVIPLRTLSLDDPALTAPEH